MPRRVECDKFFERPWSEYVTRDERRKGSTGGAYGIRDEEVANSIYGRRRNMRAVISSEYEWRNT